MDFMFSKCSELTSLDLSSFNTDKVTNMQFMFNSCTSLSELDLENFNTKNCASFTSMFTRVDKVKVNIKNKGDNEEFLNKFKDKFVIKE